MQRETNSQANATLQTPATFSTSLGHCEHQLITLTSSLFVCEHISFLGCCPLSDLVCSEVEHGHSVVGDRVWPWSSPGESEGSQVGHCHWGSYKRAWWTWSSNDNSVCKVAWLSSPVTTISLAVLVSPPQQSESSKMHFSIVPLFLILASTVTIHWLTPLHPLLVDCHVIPRLAKYATTLSATVLSMFKWLLPCPLHQKRA